MVLAYHERSKHKPGAFARSPENVDWEAQPSPFRVYDGAPNVLLAEVLTAETSRVAAERGAVLGPAYDEMFLAGAIAPSPVDFETISQLLYDSLALSTWKQSGRARWSLRVNPSNGNLHPSEAYLVLPALREVGARPAVYHYSPLLHALEERRALTPEDWEELAIPLPPDGFVLGLSSIIWRQAWKFGERAFRYATLDLGHAIGAVSLAAAALGWTVRRVVGWSEDDLALLFGVHGQRGVEAELPQVALVIAPGPTAPVRSKEKAAGPLVLHALSDDFVARARASAWNGFPNILSVAHHDWPILSVIAHATREPGTAETIPPPPPSSRRHDEIRERTFDEDLPLALTRTVGGGKTFALATEPALQPTLKLIRLANQDLSDPWRKASANVRPVRARVVLRKRRSATEMDGRTKVARDTFFRMLSRMMPTPGHPVFDAVGRSPSIHLVVFVHRVRELATGVYLLARDESAIPLLRESLSPAYLWKPIDSAQKLPLFLLERRDARALARTASCHQTLASDASFSVAMLAHFEPALRARGAASYRDLHWEAGAVGQMLYAEAEAASFRASGIGSFFDDMMHEAFGLSDRTFHVLYHFAVGGAVDDKRVLTQPPYAKRRQLLEG